MQSFNKVVTPTIFPQMMPTTKAKEAWNILTEAYRGTNKVIRVKLQTLWKEFDNLSMKKDETIQVFFNHVANTVNNIKILEDMIEDKKLAQKVLRSLFLVFDHIVAAIEESKDLSMLLVTELMGSLKHMKRICIDLQSNHWSRLFRPS